MRDWLALPTNGLLAVLLVAALAYHSYLGTAVIIEDYVHGSGMKLFWLLLLRFLYVRGLGAGIFAILRIAFGPASP